MAVLSVLFRPEFRHRRRSWILLCLLLALVSGLTLAAAAAARRTSTAFPRYEAAYGYDAFVYAENPVPKIATLPEVSSATEVQIPISGNPTCACTRPISVNDFSLFEVAPSEAAARRRR